MTAVRVLGATLALVGALVVASCSDEEAGRRSSADPAAVESSPSPSIRTLTPIPLPPEPPPSGTIAADMRQSSRDAALGRMEVWIDNDTAHTITPTRVTYTDPRLRGPLQGDRLRPAPSQSTRGFPLYLPARPDCGSTGTGGSIELAYGDTTVTLDVDDPTDVVGRYVAARCEEIAVARVADLAWDDRVVDGPVELGSTATLVLLVRPTGVPGHELVIDTVTGTPVLTSVDSPFWSPGTHVASDGPDQRIELPLMPARCDPHAFQESGGATAFRITMHLDGERGQIVLPMTPAGAESAIEFARQSCGLGD